MSAAGAGERLRIRIQHKRFPAVGDAPPKLVIENLSLEVPPRGFTALFGPSGCGKSTLLNLVAGLDPDFAGEVALPAATRIGYVFQEPRLLPWLTVEDNLGSFCRTRPRARPRSLSGSPRWALRTCAWCFPPGCRSAWRAGSRSPAPSSSSRRSC